MRDPPHRLRSSLKIDERDEFAKAPALGLLGVALDVTVRRQREDADQPPIGPQHVQGLRQCGWPYDVQDDIDTFRRPVANGPTYVFGFIINDAVRPEASH